LNCPINTKCPIYWYTVSTSKLLSYFPVDICDW